MKQILFTTIAILGMVVIANAQTVPSYVPSSGLVGWWPFNGNAKDSSGNGNNGTVNGAALTTDRFGIANNAYDFNGTSNYILINDNQTFKFSSHSISFWYFRANNPLAQGNPCANSGNELLISKGRDIDTNTFFISHTNSGGLSQVYKLMKGSRVIRDKIILGSWTNVISTFDSVSQTSKSYVNGILDSTISNIRWSSKGNNSPLTFGVHSEFNSTGCTYFYKGKLDDVGIWKRALSSCEISDLYNSKYQYSKSFLGADINACGVDSVKLSTSKNFKTYNWSNGATTKSIFAKSSGYYICSQTDYSGCSSKDTILVSVINGKISPRDTMVCSGAQVDLFIKGLTYNYSSSNGVFNCSWKQITNGDHYSVEIDRSGNWWINGRTEILLKKKGLSSWNKTNWTKGIVRSGTSLTRGITPQAGRMIFSCLDNGAYITDDLGSSYKSTLPTTGYGCQSESMIQVKNGRALMTMGGSSRAIYSLDSNATTWTSRYTNAADFNDFAVDNFGNVFSSNSSVKLFYLPKKIEFAF